MKSFSITAIVLSVVSFTVSTWTSFQADVRADAAMQRRERQFVEKYSPQVKRLCEDFGITPPANPTTIDELIEPLSKIVTSVK